MQRFSHWVLGCLLAVSLSGCASDGTFELKTLDSLDATVDQVVLTACDGVELGHQLYHVGKNAVMDVASGVVGILINMGVIKPEKPDPSAALAVVPPLCQRVPQPEPIPGVLKKK